MLAKKIDEKRSRTEAQNVHEDLLTKERQNKTSLKSLMNMTMSGKSLENFDNALGGFERNMALNPS